MLLVIFFAWVLVAEMIYGATVGSLKEPASVGEFMASSVTRRKAGG